MPLSEPEILQYLMQARQRILAAAWTVVRDTHVAEDIFQKMAVKAVTRDVSFETDSALLSWAFISVRCEGIDYLRKHKRETVGFEPDILELLEADWQLEKAAPAGAGSRWQRARHHGVALSQQRRAGKHDPGW